MIVLDGATSQWKRSDAGSAAIGPASRSPAAIRRMAWRWPRTASRSASGAIARTRASSSSTRAARKRRGRQKSTTPALTHSPRSTRGTTRTIAYWNGLAGKARLLGLGGEAARRLEPAAQVLGVRGAILRREPVRRDAVEHALENVGPEKRREPRVGLRDVPGAGQQDVVADRGKRAVGVGRRVLPSVLQVERGAVVDQPQPPVPQQQVRVLRRAVDVRAQGVEPDDLGGHLRAGRRAGRRVVRERAGEEVEADVEPAARVDQLLDLGIGLGAAQLGVQLDENDLRHGQAGGAGELAGDELRQERLRSLPGPAELEHVESVVVGFYQSGQRSAL